VEAEAEALGLTEALGLKDALGESDGEIWTVDCPSSPTVGTYAANMAITSGSVASCCPSRATVYESFPVRPTEPSRWPRRTRVVPSYWARR
jgi:hypothetical protein